MVFFSFLLLWILSIESLEPIIVLPGFAGSNLDVILKNANPPSLYCKKNSEEYQIWVNILQDIRYLHVDCLEFILELSWNESTKTAHGYEGVFVKEKDFGGIDGCSCLDRNFCLLTPYFHCLFEALQKKKGYVAGKNLFAATYDFRLSPQQIIQKNGYFLKLKKLVEDAFEENGQERVSFVCHSMGCSLSSVFLGSFSSKEWKKKYISKWISMSGVYDGSTETFGYMIVGLTPVLPSWLEWKVFGQTLQKYVSRLARKTSNWPGLQWMIPKSTVSKSDLILSTDIKNYTIGEYSDLLQDSGFGNIYQIFEAVDGLEKVYEGEYDSIDHYCIYAQNTETPVEFYVDNIQNPTVGKVVKNVEGDGIVTLKALELCDKLTKNTKILRLNNSEHQALVGDKRAIDYIIENL